MQSTIRSVTPRLITVRQPSSRKNSTTISNGAVPINQETSGISNLPAEPILDMYSLWPTESEERQVQSEDEGLVVTETRAPPPLNRWNTKTNTRDSLEHSRGPRESGHQRQSTQDRALLEDDRKSMKELSDFLRTAQPPTTNRMSNPKSMSVKSLLKGKKSLFKHLFGRQGKKNGNEDKPKLLRLPDTAVSSKTRAGHRHIAISIPRDRNYACFPSSLKSQRKLETEGRENGSITVLKGVKDVPESGPLRHPSVLFHDYDPRCRPQTAPLPPASVPEDDHPRIWRHSYADEDFHQSLPAAGTTLYRDFVAETLLDLPLRSSQWSDVRHSGGTIYSEQTLATVPGHSREPSNISTTQTTPLSFLSKSDFPPRTSSIGPSTKKIYDENSARRHVRNTSTLSGKSANDSLYSTASFPHAAVLDLQNFAIINQSPPLDAFLPLLGTESCNDFQTSRPTSAALEHPVKQQSASISSRDGETNTIEKRQERVKARKQRDIAAMRQQGSGNGSAFSEVTNESNPERSRSSSSSSSRNELARRQSATNRMSPEINIADIIPHSSTQPSEHRLRRSKMSDIDQASSQIIQTPPHSLAASSSFASLSSFDETCNPRSRAQSMFTKMPPSITLHQATPSRRSSHLSPQHHRRVVSHREAGRDVGLDTRLARIERDNAMLLYTLNSISKNFGELTKLLPTKKEKSARKEGKEGTIAKGANGERSDLRWRDREREREKRELESISPLMQELRCSSRVSQEFRTGNRMGFGDGDEGLVYEEVYL